MKKSNLIKILPLLALTASLLATLPVRAQENGPLSDTVIVAGLAPFVFQEATNIIQFFPAFAPAPGVPNGAILFYEDASQLVVSDQLWVQNGFFYFASDPDLQNLAAFGIPVVGVLVENGALQDASPFFHLPNGTVLVQSDVVPEPGVGSLALLGGGLLVALKRRYQNRGR